MKALLQRVARAEVRVGGVVHGAIGAGLLVLLGVEKGDRTQEADALAEKTAHLRIFPDEAGRMNRSLLEREGAALVVSQFTLAASTRRGRRPSYDGAAPPEVARELVDRYVEGLRALRVPVDTGVFGANMEVLLVNDGPVTILLESPEPRGRDVTRH